MNREPEESGKALVDILTSLNELTKSERVLES